MTRAHRLLLLAYPRDFRRERAGELAGLLDEAGLPVRRVALNLLRHGLRARLGRPASRSVVVLAALASVACGLFAAAAATRAAWETSPPQPTRAQAAAIFAEILPGEPLADIDEPPAMFTVYHQPLSADNFATLLFGDGGEYQQSTVSASASDSGTGPLGPVVAAIQRRMRAAGWRVYPPYIDGADCTASCEPATGWNEVTLPARRGGTILDVTLRVDVAYDTTYVSADVRRATPVAVWPAGIAGGLLGALAGWLLFGWVSRRTEGRRSVAVLPLYGFAMFLWWAPVLVSLPTAAAYNLSGDQPQWDPFWMWLGQPTASLPFLVGAGCVTLATAVAALPRRRSVPERAVAG